MVQSIRRAPTAAMSSSEPQRVMLAQSVSLVMDHKHALLSTPQACFGDCLRLFSLLCDNCLLSFAAINHTFSSLFTSLDTKSRLTSLTAHAFRILTTTFASQRHYGRITESFAQSICLTKQQKSIFTHSEQHKITKEVKIKIKIKIKNTSNTRTVNFQIPITRTSKW